MDKVTWCKNFALNKEIQIAGKFLYDGMLDLNSMTNYVDDENIFGFLYKVSVGIERLQKIAYTLIKNPSELEYENFEKELITHSHMNLHSKIKSSVSIPLSNNQNAFIQMLDVFYRSFRYNRFNLNTDIAGERHLFFNFVKESYDDTIRLDDLFPSFVDEKTKKFLGKIIGVISRSYYELIRDYSSKLGIYTYELDTLSKSMKIFHSECSNENLRQQFVNEQVAYKELLIFLINTDEQSGFYSFLKEIPPLDLDIALIQDRLYELLKGNIPLELIDEIESLYEDSEFDIKERLEQLHCIGNPGICFDYIDE